jgi:signal transduction histidine kinase/ligand-binding sensor domain-containing protein
MAAYSRLESTGYRLFAAAFIVACVFTFPGPIGAQYRFDQWTADEGLPQNSVYEITQTRDGYLWLATMDGLVRFDGRRFTVFNKSNSPGIVNNRYISVFEDRHGDFWGGMEASGVVRFRNGRFSSYGSERGLTKANNYTLFEDQAGRLIVSAAFPGLVQFAEEKFSPYEPDSADRGSTGNGQIAFGTCHIINGETCFWRGRRISLQTSPSWNLSVLIKGAEDRSGTLWIAIPGHDLYSFGADGSRKIYNELNGLPGRPLSLVQGREKISLLSKDTAGAIWLTDLEEMRSELVTRQAAGSFNMVTHAYEDREGSIWIGTMREGLYRLRRQIIKTYSKAEGLLQPNVYPIHQDRQGRIVVGTTSGLFIFENDAFVPVKGSEGSYVEALGETRDGKLLAGYFRGLVIYVSALEQDRLIPVAQIGQNLSGVNYTFYTAEDGTLWVGGVAGLMRVEDGRTTMFTEKDGLAGTDVKVVIGDGAGGMWIGSYGGLTHYRDGKFTKWTEGEGLQALTVRSLYLDGEGVLWIGSYDSGLARFKDGKFTHFTTKNGLFNDGAFQILEDDNRNFWLSSNRGIYRVRKDELNEFADGKIGSIASVAYGKSDGMLNAECNGGRSPGGIKTGDGRLWFPTQDGVAVVDPSRIKPNPNPPPVVIEDFKIDNESVGSESVYSALHDPGSVIEIQSNRQSFEIQYTALSFINSENLRFKFRLDGIDEDWVDAGTRRTAYFSYVPPGEYTFRVIAANADGVWNEVGQSLKIVVLPPFYQTWWFRILVVMTILAAGYLLVRRRIGQIDRQRLAQQNFSRQLIASQEAERKRIAAELHDSLGQRLVVIKNLAWMFLNTDDRKDDKPIKEISEEASQAISEVKTISYNLRPYQLDRIGLTKAIEAVVRSAQTASEIDFTAEIDNIDDYFPADAEINFYRIVQECLNNIVKHSQAAKAAVTIRREEGRLDLTIEDNGRGFESDENPANPKFEGPNSKSGGFGLIGIRERAELLGGKIEIKSAPDHGTTIRIVIKNK